MSSKVAGFSLRLVRCPSTGGQDFVAEFSIDLARGELIQFPPGKVALSGSLEASPILSSYLSINGIRYDFRKGDRADGYFERLDEELGSTFDCILARSSGLHVGDDNRADWNDRLNISVSSNNIDFINGLDLNAPLELDVSAASLGVQGSFNIETFAADLANGSLHTRGTLRVQHVKFTPAASPPPAVPEPATWTMMIGGFGFIGAAMRRRTPTLTYA